MWPVNQFALAQRCSWFVVMFGGGETGMSAIPSRAETQRVAVLLRLAAAAAVVTALMAALVLVGWAFNDDPLESLVPGVTTMKPLTALGLLLAAAALWLLRNEAAAAWRRRLALIFGG